MRFAAPRRNTVDDCFWLGYGGASFRIKTFCRAGNFGKLARTA